MIGVLEQLYDERRITRKEYQAGLALRNSAERNPFRRALESELDLYPVAVAVCCGDQLPTVRTLETLRRALQLIAKAPENPSGT